jgi:hypothetical protein
MPSFALISEGVTDQIVLERVIEQVVLNDVFINPLQPLRDATDKNTAPHGGWELVLEYCEQRAADALAANDYIVVHLDTDECDHPNFGVALTEQGSDRAYDALVSDVIGVISARIGQDLYQSHAERFVFAISVHSMESWLLLCLFNLDEPKNSFERLNRRLRKQNLEPIAKTGRSYERISREIKRKHLLKLKEGNHSLGLFVDRLLMLREAACDA